MLATAATLLSASMGAINGYVMSKYPFPGSRVVMPLIVFGMFIPYQSILVPLFQFLQKARLYGGLPGLIVVHEVYGLPITHCSSAVSTQRYRTNCSVRPDRWGRIRAYSAISCFPFQPSISWCGDTGGSRRYGMSCSQSLARPDAQPYGSLANLAGGQAVSWNLMAGSSSRRCRLSPFVLLAATSSEVAGWGFEGSKGPCVGIRDFHQPILHINIACGYRRRDSDGDDIDAASWLHFFLCGDRRTVVGIRGDLRLRGPIFLPISLHGWRSVRIATAPAPPWLKVGARLTYHVMSAAREGDASPAGESLVQYDVVSLDAATVLAAAGVHVIASGGTLGAVRDTGFIVGAPGVGDVWMDPAALRKAERHASQNLTIAHVTMDVGGVATKAVRFEYVQGAARSVSVFDETAGVLLYRIQASVADS